MRDETKQNIVKSNHCHCGTYPYIEKHNLFWLQDFKIIEII